MRNYKTRIEEISTILRETEEECNRRRRAIGKEFVSVAEGTTADEGVSELLSQYRTITEQIEHSSSALERMIRIDERQSEIRGKMRNVQKELEHLESGRDLAGAYEAVGAAAFRLFKEHPLVDATYSTVFSGVARFQDQMRRIDAQLEQLQTDPAGRASSLIDKISRGGRNVILRNKRTVKENQLPGLLQKLGRDLAHTDFFDAMDDEELTTASEPIRAAERQKTLLKEQIEELSEESRQLVEEFNALSGGSRLSKAQKDREAEIAEAQEKLNKVLLQLGQAAHNERPETLTSEIEALEHDESRAAHFRTILDRLEMGQKAESLGDEISGDNVRMARLNERITALQDEKGRLEHEVRQKEAERENLIAQRGDEDELFGK